VFKDPSRNTVATLKALQEIINIWKKENASETELLQNKIWNLAPKAGMSDTSAKERDQRWRKSKIEICLKPGRYALYIHQHCSGVCVERQESLWRWKKAYFRVWSAGKKTVQQDA